MTNLYQCDLNDWQPKIDDEQAKTFAKSLESGKVLYFPNLPFALLDDEKSFMKNNVEGMKAKNVSYNPVTGRLRGIMCSPKNEEMLQKLNARFYHSAKNLNDKPIPIL